MRCATISIQRGKGEGGEGDKLMKMKENNTHVYINVIHGSQKKEERASNGEKGGTLILTP